ncbi:polysaccharide biosynthesis C-terminal domain-containing protein [Vibrio vulnificus]|nr:polysaccharide biosynthesis C-terminal domain-containing protein [Vibrio vulnificus]
MRLSKKISPNLFFFGLSTFISKGLAILLLPIYSRSLSVGEYGILDVILTFLMLLLPFVTFALYESVLKYCLEGNFSRKKLISTAFFVTVINAIILFLMLIFASKIFGYEDYVWFLMPVLFLMSIFELFSKYANGTENTIIYTKANIFISALLITCVIFFVYLGRYGIMGVLTSYIISYLAGNIYVCYALSLHKKIKISFFDLHVLKRMLAVSSPLIPNALMWWVFNAGDRAMVLYYSGSDDAGIYAVSNKISAIVVLFHTILFQAWQISAVKEKGNVKFYAIMIQRYYLFMVFMVSLLISLNKYVLGITLPNSYSNAWYIGNVLIVSSLFFSIASFIGVFYVVYNDTKSALRTSCFAAVLNLTLNFILIPPFGAYGAAIATLISTLSILIFRVVSISKHVSIKLSNLFYYLLPFLLFFQLLSMNFMETYIISIVSTLVLLFIFVRDFFVRCENE